MSTLLDVKNLGISFVTDMKKNEYDIILIRYIKVSLRIILFFYSHFYIGFYV
mgnify:CR=1 FL=1